MSKCLRECSTFLEITFQAGLLAAYLRSVGTLGLRDFSLTVQADLPCLCSGHLWTICHRRKHIR